MPGALSSAAEDAQVIRIYAATNLAIAGFGTILFVGMAFVDFYTMPRTYQDEQYLAGALGMYLTYINLFIFILRFIIAIQSRD